VLNPRGGVLTGDSQALVRESKVIKTAVIAAIFEYHVTTVDAELFFQFF